MVHRFLSSLRPCISLVLAWTVGGAGMLPGADPAPVDSPWKPLLDAKLSQWEVFMGVPHDSVTGLPPGTPTSKTCKEGIPLGLGHDPKGVFTIIEDAGQPVLRVSGEIFGGLTTLASYHDYHLTAQYRWGEKRWPPRENALRDNGILYHGYSAHGEFWKVWMRSVEFQVQEGDVGDLFLLAGPKADVRMTEQGVWDPVQAYALPRNRVKHGPSNELPAPAWNTIDLYVLGDRAIHVVNGRVVNAIEHLHLDSGPLTAGRLQIQSEGAEISYRDLRVRDLAAFPPELVAAAGFDRP